MGEIMETICKKCKEYTVTVKGLCFDCYHLQIQDKDCFVKKSSKERRKEMYAVIKTKDCGQHSFTYFHANYKDARAEAERLCRKEQTGFYVLKVVSKCSIGTMPVVWEDL